MFGADCGWSAVGGQTQSAYVRGGFRDDDTFAGHSVSKHQPLLRFTLTESFRTQLDRLPEVQWVSLLATPPWPLEQRPKAL